MNKMPYISPGLIFLEIVDEGVLCGSAFVPDSDDVVLFNEEEVL
jgi:hypothetical protein